jgi:tetratricopeptide (TPR) repeat protein
MRKAHELRERASERERRRIEATYHQIVTGGLLRSLDANALSRRYYPRDGTAHLNAGNLYMQLGQWEQALEEAEIGLQMLQSNVAFSNLAIVQMALGRHDEARRTLESAMAKGVDAYYLRLDAYQEAFLRGDDEAMRRHCDAVAGRQGEEDFLIAAQADTEACFGRMERSRELTARAAESALRAGAPEMSALWIAQAALREAELGFSERAIDGADAALNRSSGRHVRAIAAYALARAGDRTTVEPIARELDHEFPEDTITQRYWLPCIRAAMSLDSGQWEAAVRTLEQAESFELSLTVPFESGFAIPPYLRGVAYVAGGRHDEAAREFAKIVSRPGLLKNFVIHRLAADAAKSLASR